MTRPVGRSIAIGAVVLAVWTHHAASLAAIDSGVIRLAQPAVPAESSSEAPSRLEPGLGARHGFDVEAFDGRFESLWFQRKAYNAEGRDEDAARNRT